MFYTYILASQKNGTLYIGSTDHLAERVRQHREKTFGGFTARYGVETLVWFELYDSREEAFLRERRLKKWNRAWKIQPIEELNPRWIDLFGKVTLTAERRLYLGPRVRGDERNRKGRLTWLPAEVGQAAAARRSAGS